MLRIIALLAFASVFMLPAPAHADWKLRGPATSVRKRAPEEWPRVRANIESPQTAPADGVRRPLQIAVLVIEFDPLVSGQLASPGLPGAAGRSLREFGGWPAPTVLTGDYMQDVYDASGGSIRYEIANWQMVPRLPNLQDGFSYTPETYLHGLRTGGADTTAWHTPESLDLATLADTFQLAQRVAAREFDEVWLVLPPHVGVSGVCMLGGGALDLGSVCGSAAGERRFVVVTCHYDQSPTAMLDLLAQRVAATLATRVPEWPAYIVTVKDEEPAGAGTGRWPPNAEREGDFASPRPVLSTADDWRRYPELTGQVREVSCKHWSRPYLIAAGQPDYQRNYLCWWLRHLPRTIGTDAAGRPYNWWEYMFDFNSYGITGELLPPNADDAVPFKSPGVRRPR